MGCLAKKIKEHYERRGFVGVCVALGKRLQWWLLLYPKEKWRIYRKKREEKKRLKKDEDELPVNERGRYHARRLHRIIVRQLNRLIYRENIMQSKNTRILVVLHFFYVNSIDEVVEYLKNLGCYNYDLVVTYPDVCPYEEMKEKLKKLKPEVRFEKCDNKGYDIAGFLKVIQNTNLKNYDIVIKLQTKSVNKTIFVYDQLFKDRDWFLNLWNGVVGGRTIHKTIKKLREDGNCGIVAAKNLIINDPEHKKTLVKETLENYDKIKYIEDYKFVAGSCFAIRSECLAIIKKAKIDVGEFEETRYGFFSLAHVVERAICFAGMQGYKYYGNKVDRWKKMKWHKLEKRLKNMSALKITRLNGCKFSPDFVWHVLEKRFMDGYKITFVPVGKIRRIYFDGTIKKLQECEPYLYLEGDVKTYKKYAEFQRKNNLPHMTISRFDKLLESIKKNGYDEAYPVILGRRNSVWDGQHRACVLLKLYGEDCKVKAIKINAVDIDFDKIKPFSDKICSSPVFY